MAETEMVMSVTAVAVGIYYAEICVPVLHMLYYIFFSELLLLDIADCCRYIKPDAEIIAT